MGIYVKLLSVWLSIYFSFLLKGSKFVLSTTNIFKQSVLHIILRILKTRPDMTLDVYSGRKTTTQQQQHILKTLVRK